MSIRVIQRHKDEAVVRAALDRLGIDRDLAELLKVDYSDQLIEVLIELLDEVRDPIMKLEVVKALCGPYPQAYERVEKVLVDEYFNSVKSLDLPGFESLAWGVANCLEIIASPTSPHLNAYKSIVGNRSYGITRQMLVLALSKFDTGEVEDVLIALLDDMEVAGHAVMALGKVKSKKALPSLKKLESSRVSWIRREAKKSARLIETPRKTG